MHQRMAEQQLFDPSGILTFIGLLHLPQHLIDEVRLGGLALLSQSNK